MTPPPDNLPHGVPKSWPTSLPVPSDPTPQHADFPDYHHSVWAVAASDTTYVASVGSGRHHDHTTFWYSTDGLHWRRATVVADETLDRASASVGGLVALPVGGFVSAGTTTTGEQVTWTSPDGRTWTPHLATPLASFARRRDFVVTELVFLGDRLFGLGSPCCGYGVLLWVSDDEGQTWRATDQDYFGGVENGGSMVCGFTEANGAYTITAVHPEFRSGSGHVKAAFDTVWTSTDGLEWDLQSSTPRTDGPLTDQSAYCPADAGQDLHRFAAGPAGVLWAPGEGAFRLWTSD